MVQLQLVTEAICLVSVQLVKSLLLLNEWLSLLWQEFMMYFVTKAKPINSTDGICHIKKLKSSRTRLTSYSGFISFNNLGGGHTH